MAGRRTLFVINLMHWASAALLCAAAYQIDKCVDWTARIGPAHLLAKAINFKAPAQVDGQLYIESAYIESASANDVTFVITYQFEGTRDEAFLYSDEAFIDRWFRVMFCRGSVNDLVIAKGFRLQLQFYFYDEQEPILRNYTEHDCYFVPSVGA